jgi:NAD+ kinase
MKVALQIHPTRIPDEMLQERVYPILARLDCESYALPRRHDGEIELAADTDLVLTLGGDGTFLYGSRVALLHGVPIIGVKVGRLGFLCSFELADLHEALADVLAGRMPIEERHVLHGEIVSGQSSGGVHVALNDIVVFRSDRDTLRDLTAYDNGQLIARYRADGVILATALGSTAYNMSAGGPLVHPSMELIILTPICAHSLFTKPLVLPPTDRIEIVGSEGSHPLTVSFDGEYHATLNDGDRLVVSSCDTRLKLYRPESYNFYQVLRRKFQHGYVYEESSE